VSTRAGGRLGLILWVAALAATMSAAPPGLAATDGAEDAARAVLRKAPAALCPQGILEPEAQSDSLASALPGYALAGVADRGEFGLWSRREIRLENGAEGMALVVAAARTGETLRRVAFEVRDLAADRPIMMALADGDCRLQHARAIRYGPEGAPRDLVLYAADLATVETVEPLNPPVPAGDDPGGVTVAHIDSGVNYLLPEIARRLARDESGRPLGRDLWDGDDRPFDGDVRGSPFFPIRHGTPVASVLIAEAPQVRLLPLRYPRPDMTRMAEAVTVAAAAGADIVALPMGSRNPEDWASFAEAAAAHPDLLFVVSAGNDGRDIDAAPLYPASLALENMVVVTSSDDFGRLAPGSNWGAESVDLMVPAERLEVTDYRGARGSASGSSYAVPRVAALAARLKRAHPDWRAAELKRALFDRAVATFDRGAPRLAVGWIPNPADDG
jgi:subtilisin family serine protease